MSEPDHTKEQRMYCQLEQIRVHYEVYGEGRPFLILHGWGQNLRFLLPYLEPLFQDCPGWQRIYLDLPGHGQTRGEDWIKNQDQMLKVVLEFIDQVIPKQRFVIGGVSLGAYLARGVVHHKAAWIDGLLMLVPTIVAEHAKRKAPPRTILIEEPGILDKLKAQEREIFELVVVRTQKFLDNLRAMSPADETPADVGFLSRFFQPSSNYAFTFDVDALPEPFRAPTLMVTGRQDFGAGYQDAWAILERYPRATFVVLDRAGHLLEEKEEVLRVLTLEWLERVEECMSESNALR